MSSRQTRSEETLIRKYARSTSGWETDDVSQRVCLQVAGSEEALEKPR